MKTHESKTNDDADEVMSLLTETEQYMEDIRRDNQRNFKKTIDNIFGSTKTISSDK